MGKFDSNPAGSADKQNVVNTNNPKQNNGPAEGTMPVVIGPDVRQMLAVAGGQVISNKLSSLFKAMDVMLGRIQVAPKGTDYFP